MYGPHIGTLNVYVDTYGQQRQRWSKTGTQGNKWKQASVYISTLYDFSVSFEAVKGKGWSGDIAMDDIQVGFTRTQSGMCCIFCSDPFCLSP